MRISPSSSMLCGCLLALAACSNPTDDSRNIFPFTAGSGDAAPDVQEEITVDPTSESFLVDCIRIETLGSVGPDGFQTQFLGRAWTADITAHKLNVLFDVVGRNVGDGQLSLQLHSGVGTSISDMCNEPSSDSPVVEGSFVVDGGDKIPFVGAEGGPPTEEDPCIVDMPDSSGLGDIGTVQLGPDQRVFIYAEDDTGVPFNCTSDPTPDAVPLRAIQFTMTLSPDGKRAAGRLNGCLSMAEATKLCSCIGKCVGSTGPGDVQADGPCQGCPVGGKPLATQLAGVQPTANCTAILGEEAFDLIANFSATRMPKKPVTCE
ncbi:MAG: hypothetical protein H6744_07955 [Deltaproteobacteria bacterium]|nr:hypothetical protein [Deltaproteobacteria bacterium]MCB9786614.1 hypothetical protein [Deltaproteobacteria bacterium]